VKFCVKFPRSSQKMASKFRRYISCCTLEKAGRTSWHFLDDHISQPQHGRCHRADTGQTTLKVIGSKASASRTMMMMMMMMYINLEKHWKIQATT